MALVSDRLRAARERAGLQIADVSATTRIKPAFLLAIEEGEFDRLPGEFFARAFLKTYARELGLNADEVLSEYDGARPAPHGTSAARRSDHASSGPAYPPVEAEAPRRRSIWPALAVIAGLLLVVTRFNPSVEQGRGTPAEAVGTVGVAEAASPAPTTAPQPSAPETLRLDIRPAREIWVTAYADQERVVYRLLQPGEQVTLEARQQFSLRIGQAGAFEYTINGVPGKSLGGPGDVRDVQITRDNYRTFQRSQ